MKHFSSLFTQLDQTTKTLLKIRALVNYFSSAREEDKLWAVALLSHRRPKRSVNTNFLKLWAAEISGIPSWLFEESYHVVGDLSETISLVLPEKKVDSNESLTYWITFIRSLETLSVDEKREKISWAWERLDDTERFVFNKLITGSFRIGVSQQLIVKALAKYTGIKENIVAHKVIGSWSPDTITLQQLINETSLQTDHSKPYPFYLAYALEGPVSGLGAPDEWIAERKWDGIRGQVIVRNDELFVWTRGQELVTDKYPEYEILKELIPNGTVLDGEILPFKEDKPMTFQFLQTRIGRKKLTPKITKDVPVVFIAYDVLEWKGEDVRELSFKDRRIKLQEVINDVDNPVLKISAEVQFATWEELATERLRSRDFLSEGIMLKRKNSIYRDGRRRGDWWKWKIDALTVDAVMIYAMRGHGRRSNLYTDYTFAVWDDGQLVPFAKAYSGLTDEEINKVDYWIKQNTIERFGPVRSVKPELVFELAFEGIQKSSRHKSGLALRFPRIHRWRKDKPAGEANTLEDLKSLL
jgi:DNA ligase-1